MKTLFRLCGYFEAASFLYLLVVAMPQKYMQGDLHATRTPGSIHGFLFVAYLVLAYAVAERDHWPSKMRWGAFIASVFPLGTVVFDFTYLRKHHALKASE